MFCLLFLGGKKTAATRKTDKLKIRINAFKKNVFMILKLEVYKLAVRKFAKN